MKRTLALLIGMMICASVARGGDVKITVVTSAGEKGKPATVFAADTPEIRATFKTKGAKKGDKLRGEWIADDVGEAAPPNTKIVEKTLTLEGDTDAGYFTFLKPTNGWPPGTYHLDIYANDALATRVGFTIEDAKKTETASKESAAGDMQITAVMATGPDAKPTATFASDTPKVFAVLQMKGVKKGDKLRAVWFADDVEGAPVNTKIGENARTMEGDPAGGNFSCAKPAEHWAAGKYHVDIYANDKLATTVKFTIEAGEKTTAEKTTAEKPAAEKPAVEKPATEKTTTKRTEEESEESDDADDTDDDQYTFKVHNANVQRITKLLASEDGKDYANFDIGKGIDVGETVRLNWDKSTNKSGCKWYLKAVYADKSVGEAVKFDFCEEDLVIDF
jgi:hypothetical protein